MQIEITDHVKVSGLWNVAISRLRTPKHNYIPDGNWPSHMDIQVQRMNPYVIESEIFERAIKTQSSKTLRRWTYHSGKQYGSLWTKEESEVANFIDEAYKLKLTNVNEIRQFICDKTFKTKNIELIANVIEKVNNCYENLVLENLHF